MNNSINVISFTSLIILNLLYIFPYTETWEQLAMSSLLKQKGRSIRHFRNILSRTSETMGNLKKEKKRMI